MSSKNIFIHIPKTGGTTINCVMNKTEWQTKPDFNYRHILYETKRSNSKDIFNPLNYNKYDAYHIFMLLRNPIDRLISEYYFIKDRQEFMSLIKPVPRNLKEYIKSKQTQNYMIGFLLGKRMYDEELVTQSDYDLVINTINNLPINVGVFEEYAKSLQHFSSITGIKLPKNIDIKRITLNRPKLDKVSQEIKDLVIKHNALDFKLYNYCVKKFEENTKDLKQNKSLNFRGDKYNYVLKYTERFNLLEIGIKNKKFIYNNTAFFQELNNYLHHSLKLKDGEEYVSMWNACFIKTINSTYTNSPLSIQLNKLKDEKDPLKNTEAICSVINKTIMGNSFLKYNKKLHFNKNLIPEKASNTNTSFFTSIKNKIFK
ncbi:sulfotransferase family 2 domain-containing protein [Oceanihabitans sp. 2_MG-2023]|uniref:sulfotransferase family 2 domain-containing protein n=1 Tax=Oceanihabitans sp. 2_MG-2023 TaxID=3062661 RepID=UPI0026E14586|nr:sulfotransferase family 2 domain-containing protein [Oceanihabitans sp. 2_MG-2023]MDO6597189.1 sulfotransferase family 2 domain-containing protein [Oceanihabitans sp. 2_MG-2023]